jgi:hypothetical protein
VSLCLLSIDRALDRFDKGGAGMKEETDAYRATTKRVRQKRPSPRDEEAP